MSDRSIVKLDPLRLASWHVTQFAQRHREAGKTPGETKHDFKLDGLDEVRELGGTWEQSLRIIDDVFRDRGTEFSHLTWQEQQAVFLLRYEFDQGHTRARSLDRVQRYETAMLQQLELPDGRLEKLADLVFGGGLSDEEHQDRDRREEAYRQRIRAEAREQVQRELAAEDWDPPGAGPGTLEDWLRDPPDPVTYRVDQLMQVEHRVLLQAKYKVGKTVMVGNLVKALADGTPFLGKFEVAAPAGNIWLWDFEMGERQWFELLRALDVKCPERIVPLSLRGRRLPLSTSQDAEDWAVEWLGFGEIETWLVDPFGRAFDREDENRTRDVRPFTTALDVICRRAGVSDLVLTTHMGHQNERARGGSALMDWPDALWYYVRDEDSDARFFSAEGRDVELAESELKYDPGSHELTLVGGSRKSASLRRTFKAVREYLTEHPGASGAEVDRAVRIGNPSAGLKQKDIRDVLATPELFTVEDRGGRVGKLYTVSPGTAWVEWS